MTPKFHSAFPGFKIQENNTKAQKYLESRNITNKEIGLFSIGFANDSWDTITQILKQKKY